MFSVIENRLGDIEGYARLKDAIRGGQTPCSVFGVAEGLKPYILRALWREYGVPVIFITQNDYKALSFCNADGEGVYFPSRELSLRPAAARGRESASLRIKALKRLMDEGGVMYASQTAVRARLIPRAVFEESFIAIEKEKEYDIRALLEKAVRCGYERVAAVEGEGQIALRGDILDIYSPGMELPVRVDFFGDRVERIAHFEPATQRSAKKELQKAVLAPAVEILANREAVKNAVNYFALELKRIRQKNAYALLTARVEEYINTLAAGRTFEDAPNYVYAMYEPTSVLDYFPGCIVVFDSFSAIRESAKVFEQEFEESLKSLYESHLAMKGQEELFLPLEDIAKKAREKTALEFCLLKKSGDLKSAAEMEMHSRRAQGYDGKLEPLREDLKYRMKNGWRTYLFTGSMERAHSLSEYLNENGIAAPISEDAPEGGVAVSADPLKEGFELTAAKTYILGENEIYGAGRAKQKAKSMKKQKADFFYDLKPGDIIVHDIHGKGRYLGLKTETAAGRTRDYMLLEYRDNDRLYIPVDQIDRVQKYISGSDSPPRLSKLGAREWETAKQKVKQSLKELAQDLLLLYSERHNRKGYIYAKDTVWQKQFEEHFPYEETGGQLKSIEEIKRDMESPRIMDRLILGDVGYGKTEVAMRACFKAAMDGKQTAVLAPTTLLCRQHYHTFLERFKGFPVNIGVLSRFVPKSEQAKTLKALREGNIDIIIGTHRLLSKDVQYHELGLLIIDEEQRFGVGHKETIKDIKKTVDVLTLTATPIPRTLEMSMIGIRDMSTIDTPIEDRIPVQTYVMEYSGELLREAVLREKARGGQVYFVCRQIRQMDYLSRQLLQFVPEAAFKTAHGQMNQTELERVMEDFIGGEFDVLLSTTIVESGLDIPMVNTIIIFEADKFGLAQLYQLKGRVGRSAAVSYAYLTYSADEALSMDAEKRLNTLREFTEFGAGFKIAMRDLEIRGAGNMLGPEQSGHMVSVGYEMYLRLMRDAVSELKGEKEESANETVVEIELDAHISADYVENEEQKIEYYKRIAAIDGVAAAQEILEDLADRYGKPPKPAENLVTVALIRHFANKAGIAFVSKKQRHYELKFFENAEISPEKLIKAIASYEESAVLRPQHPPVIIFKPQKRPLKELIEFLNGIAVRM
jgi:transcription-repair coupling factor (superfamily II helicase)